jgi:hypothetical protein
MSKIIEVQFTVGTKYVGSEVEETVEIEIEENMTEEEINKIIDEEFQIWVWENIDSWWKIIG